MTAMTIEHARGLSVLRRHPGITPAVFGCHMWPTESRDLRSGKVLAAMLDDGIAIRQPDGVGHYLYSATDTLKGTMDNHVAEPDDGLGLYCKCGRLMAHPGHTAPVEPLPDLPYAGTSGHSGGTTSRERAIRDDTDGTTTERQDTVLRMLGFSIHRDGVPLGLTDGLTWREVAMIEGWHHGQASGVLSVLHKTERIARLIERRDRCFVYVLPEYVNGRETQAQGGRGEARLQEARAEGWDTAHEALCATFKIHGHCGSLHPNPYLINQEN